jgi:hypothetical protein
MSGKSAAILFSIGNLPPQVTRKALKAHLQQTVYNVGGSGFRLAPAICSCNILRLTDPTTGLVTHQALFAVKPARLAFEVAAALEATPLRGIKLRVSRYRHGTFPVPSGMPTISIRELLGLTDDQASAGTPPPQLDLVSDTGRHKHGSVVQHTDSDLPGLLAH